jgi:hypothetical protein
MSYFANHNVPLQRNREHIVYEMLKESVVPIIRGKIAKSHTIIYNVLYTNYPQLRGTLWFAKHDVFVL